MAYEIYDPMSSFRSGLTSSEDLAKSIMKMRKSRALQPYIAPTAKAQLDLTKAQAQKATAQAQDPFSGKSLTGTAGESYSTMMYEKEYGDNPHAMAVLKSSQNAKTSMANARWWSSLPSAERGQVIAKLKTEGIDPVTSTRGLMNGMSPQDMINAHIAGLREQAKRQLQAPQVQQPQVQQPEAGVPQQQGVVPSIQSPIEAQKLPQTGEQSISPGIQPGAQTLQQGIAKVLSTDTQQPTTGVPPTPQYQDIQGQYAPQAPVLARAQEQASSAAGLKYLGDFVAKNIKYGGVIAKGGRPWYWDAISGDPVREKKAIKFYTAHSINPEHALARMGAFGGQASARAIAAIAPTLLGDFHIDVGLIPPAIQQQVQRLVTEKLTGMAAAMGKQVLARDPTIFQGVADTTSQPTQPTSRMIKGSDGKMYSIDQLRKISQGK